MSMELVLRVVLVETRGNSLKNIEKVRLNKATLFFLKSTLFVIPFLTGLYYEWQSCLLTILLAVYLCIYLKVCGRLTITLCPAFLATVVITLAYGISALWAVDSGMALLGFAKFLPLPLFAILLMQLSQNEREQCLAVLPLSGVVSTLVALGLSWSSALTAWFEVNGRLAGFFQYPNTYALFLLLCFIILAQSEKLGGKQILYIAVLLGGILLSGSRSVFILLILLIPLLCIVAKQKKIFRIATISMVTLVISMALIYAFTTGNLTGATRFLTTSMTSSTLLGRILYCKDALPVIIKNPFGLGYMGYYFTQGTFQTGVYSVAYIHNELLQLLLDIGWIPPACLVYAVIKSFLEKNIGITHRLIIVAVCLHCMLDFDLQFLAIFFVFMMCLDWNSGKEYWFTTRVLGLATLAVIACIGLYFGSVNALHVLGRSQMAVSLFPYYTNAQLALLTEADTVQIMEVQADAILSHNKSCALAYSAKANAAYAVGDFEHMIFYKENAIVCAKYSLEEYLSYFDMLQIGIALYTEAGDTYSANYCRERLLAIPNMLETVLQKTDSLAWRITDKPKLELPVEYITSIQAISEIGNQKEGG